MRPGSLLSLPALPHLRQTEGSIVAVTTAATRRYPVRDGLSSIPKAAVGRRSEGSPPRGPFRGSGQHGGARHARRRDGRAADGVGRSRRVCARCARPISPCGGSGRPPISPKRSASWHRRGRSSSPGSISMSTVASPSDDFPCDRRRTRFAGAYSRGAVLYPGHHAATRPDHPAIVMADTDEVITYAELDEEANRLSNLFRDIGLKPGDHIAFCLENNARFLVLCWGALRRTRLHRDEQPPPPTRWRTSSTTAGRGLHHLAVQSRPGRGVARPDAQRRAAALDGRRNRRLRLLRGRRRQRLAHPARAPHRRHGHALQLRHDRPTQGRAPTVPETPLEESGTGVAGLLALLFGANEESRYSRRRRSTTLPRCDSPWARMSPAAPSS